MKDILVVAKLKEGKFETFMGFMKSEEGMNERKKIADLTKTIGTVSPDKSAVMFKIAVHNESALHSFWMVQILYQNQFLVRLWKAMRFLS